MTQTILEEIIAWKRIEVEQCKQAKSIERVQAEAAQMPPPRDFAAALRAPGVSLIAEIKRASPSKGAIRPDLDPAALARVYAENGAAAISVLTDGQYFGGSLDDLRAVRQAVDIPVLRKEFIVDPYQVYEARAAGADALLLIAAALNDDELASLYALVRDLDMSALVEVHNEAELARALRIGPRVVGVNNRDLKTFAVDLETTARLRPLIPVDVMLVAESGIHTGTDVDRLRRVGVDAMLVGEALVRAENVAEKVRQFTHHASHPGVSALIYVKICGLTNLDDAYCAAEAGADFLGFIFYPPSPRYLPPERVHEITRIIDLEFGFSRPRFVGVFVDAPPGEVGRTIEIAGLDLAQLHGGESLNDLQTLAPRAFKALRPQTVEEALAGLETYRPAFSPDPSVPELLVDAYHPAQYGGTGEQADLRIAQALSGRCRLLLAGGLTPDNVAEAVRQVRPWGVDVSSGVEASKGKKDHGRIRAFVEAVRETGD